MNASATIRNDFIRASRLSFQHGSIGEIPTTRWPNLQPAKITFTLVDYAEYHAKMKAVKIEEGPIYDNTCDIEDPEMGKTEKLAKMFTEFSLRDPAYLVTILFLIGSILFLVNSIFGLIPFAAPELAFAGLMTIAFPVTIFVGASAFLIAGIIDLLGAFNAENGVMEIAKTQDGAARLEHQPALLGSEEWSWSACGRFRKLLRTDPAFQAGFFQFCGGLVLSVSAWTTIPGLIDPKADYFPLLAFVPQVIGGAMIFIGNLVVMFAEQDRWWKPKVTDAGWQGALWGGLGGFGFMWSGIFLLVADFVLAAWASFAGSVAFLLGSVLVWYDTMEVV